MAKPNMLNYACKETIGTMLVNKKWAGDAPGLNFRESISSMPVPIENNAGYSGL